MLWYGFREVGALACVFQVFSRENGMSPFGRVLEEKFSKRWLVSSLNCVCRGLLCVLVRFGMFSSIRPSRGKKKFFCGWRFFRKEQSNITRGRSLSGRVW